MEYPKTVEEMLAACVGCGLCRTGDSRGMRLDDGGFLKPADMKEGEIEAMAAYCPSANSPQKWPDSVWGDYLEAYLGWSANENIRFRSSSGGVTTGVLCGLLDQGLVDCVLCVKAVPDNPAGAQGIICRTPCEVEECCGSRYVTCSPLLSIEELFRGTVNFAVVGRPCDIKGLRLYFEAHPEYRERCVAISLSSAPEHQAPLLRAGYWTSWALRREILSLSGIGAADGLGRQLRKARWATRLVSATKSRGAGYWDATSLLIAGFVLMEWGIVPTSPREMLGCSTRTVQDLIFLSILGAI